MPDIQTDFRVALEEVRRLLAPIQRLADISEAQAKSVEELRMSHAEKVEELNGKVQSLTHEKEALEENLDKVKGHAKLLCVIVDIIHATPDDHLRETLLGIRGRLMTDPNITLEQLQHTTGLLCVR